MSVNNSPIFAVGSIGATGATLFTANTAQDGTGSNVVLIYSATKLTKIERIHVRTIGVCGVLSMVRLYKSLFSGGSIAADNSLFEEVPTQIQAAVSQTEKNWYKNLIYTDLMLEPGYCLRAHVTVTIVGGIHVQPFGEVFET